MSSHWLNLLKSGHYQRRREPDLIPIQSLKSYLKKSSNYRSLAQSIAYSLSTPAEERDTELWIILKRSSMRTDWQHIAVFSLPQPKNLKGITAINYKELYDLVDSYPVFKKQLIEELQTISIKGI